MRNFYRSGLVATLLLLGFAAVAAGATEIKIGADRRIRITDDWRFFKGEAAGGAKRFQRFRLASSQPAARLGDRRSVRPQN
jgi:hypothetical protein